MGVVCEEMFGDMVSHAHKGGWAGRTLQQSAAAHRLLRTSPLDLDRLLAVAPVASMAPGPCIAPLHLLQPPHTCLAASASSRGTYASRCSTSHSSVTP